MIAPITIRPVTPADFPQWKLLWDGYNDFYGRSGPTALPEETTRLTWSRFLDIYEPMHAVVAERDNQLVGLVHFIYHRSTIALTANCYLQDLFTAGSARGQGVGGALIEEVYRCADAAGCARVYWLTHESNTTARALYDKVAENSGFLVYRRNLPL